MTYAANLLRRADNGMHREYVDKIIISEATRLRNAKTEAFLLLMKAKQK